MLIPFGVFSAGAGGGAAAGTFDLISSTILTGSQASVTFDTSTLGSTYKHLQIRAAYRTSSVSFDSFSKLTFNGSSTSYQSHALFGNGSSVVGQFWNESTYILSLFAQGNGSTANAFGGGVLDILDFASSSKNTTIRDLSGRTASDPRISLSSGAWFNTAAVTSVVLTPDTGNYLTGSRFSLYGIKG